MSWFFDDRRFDRLVEQEARKIAAQQHPAEQGFTPAASTMEVFWHVAKNDRARLREWMAQRAPDEVTFFRKLWKSAKQKGGKQ